MSYFSASASNRIHKSRPIFNHGQLPTSWLWLKNLGRTKFIQINKIMGIFDTYSQILKNLMQSFASNGTAILR